MPPTPPLATAPRPHPVVWLSVLLPTALAARDAAAGNALPNPQLDDLRRHGGRAGLRRGDRAARTGAPMPSPPPRRPLRHRPPRGWSR
jgi:hypothetical protein